MQIAVDKAMDRMCVSVNTAYSMFFGGRGISMDFLVWMSASKGVVIVYHVAEYNEETGWWDPKYAGVHLVEVYGADHITGWFPFEPTVQDMKDIQNEISATGLGGESFYGVKQRWTQDVMAVVHKLYGVTDPSTNIDVHEYATEDMVRELVARRDYPYAFSDGSEAVAGDYVVWCSDQHGVMVAYAIDLDAMYWTHGNVKTDALRVSLLGDLDRFDWFPLSEYAQHMRSTPEDERFYQEVKKQWIEDVLADIRLVLQRSGHG